MLYIYYKMREALAQGGGGGQEDRKRGEGKSREKNRRGWKGWVE